MNRLLTTLGSAAVGAGLMYVLDPVEGRRRRAFTRDKMIRFGHDAQKIAGKVNRDMRNRLTGLSHGDLSVLAGGRRAVRNPFRGSWSPSARALMGVTGLGLVAYGLTRAFPMACVLGTAGIALTAEGISNAGIEDIIDLRQKVPGGRTQPASSSRQRAAASR